MREPASDSPRPDLSGVVAAAVAHLADDGFIAYPTETVWGLGACADRPRAIDRLIAWKGRSSDAPMSVLVPSPSEAARVGCALEGQAARLAEAFWPGPLTLVVPSSQPFAAGVGGEDGALGLRCSTHPLAEALAQALLRHGLGPLTSTSLNRTGSPPARTRQEAELLLAGRSGKDEPLLCMGAEGCGWGRTEHGRRLHGHAIPDLERRGRRGGPSLRGRPRRMRTSRAVRA